MSIPLSSLPARYQNQVVAALHPKKAPPSPGNPPKSEDNPVSFQLPYPPSANRYWRSIVIGGRLRVLVSREAREYKKRAAEIARLSCVEPTDKPVMVRLNFWRPRRIGDLDNLVKVTLDAIKGVAFVDDSQVKEIYAKLGDCKDAPRVLVEVIPLSGPMA